MIQVKLLTNYQTCPQALTMNVESNPGVQLQIILADDLIPGTIKRKPSVIIYLGNKKPGQGRAFIKHHDLLLKVLFSSRHTGQANQA